MGIFSDMWEWMCAIFNRQCCKSFRQSFDAETFENNMKQLVFLSKQCETLRKQCETLLKLTKTFATKPTQKSTNCCDGRKKPRTAKQIAAYKKNFERKRNIGTDAGAESRKQAVYDDIFVN